MSVSQVSGRDKEGWFDFVEFLVPIGKRELLCPSMRRHRLPAAQNHNDKGS